MMTIELKDLHFYAYHGLYEEEQLLGNDFVVQVAVSYLPGQLPVSQLAQTIDYGIIFEIVAQAMRQPTPLLETVVTQIADAIRTQFSEVVSIQVTLEKCKPPVMGWNGSAVVGYQWQAPQNL